jgi:GNAT superfamily N-acetyltransferase
MFNVALRNNTKKFNRDTSNILYHSLLQIEKQQRDSKMAKRVLLFFLAITVLPHENGSLSCFVNSFQFRSASDNDVSSAKKILFQQAMNPLSVSKERLLVAFDESQNDKTLLGFGQIRPLGGDNDEVVYSELASLYVLPEHRKQGIGGALVEALLERHKASSSSSKRVGVCLLTLKPTAPFYETYGFHVASESERKQLPSSIQLEFKAGTALSMFLGNDLVCMIEQ